jgi:KUP system potassium uptake protein
MPSLTGAWRLLSGSSSAESSSISSPALKARQPAHPEHGSRLGFLTLGAIGVVYGDIGTSPLYALRECFHPIHGVAPTPENVLGVLSLIFWSLTLII